MVSAAHLVSTPNPWRLEADATMRLAWPLILSNLTMALIGATDVMMIGWLGPRELAAATLGFNLAMSCAIFCMGLITASAPLMASEIGRMGHSVRDVRRTFRQAIWAAITVIIPFWLLLWNTESLLLAFGQEADLARNAGLYISAYMWSILPFLCFIILRNFVSALEEPIWALVISVVGVLANFLFNYALIFGKFGVPAFGVIGAGIGSVMTNVLMFGGMVLVVLWHKRFRRYHLFGRFSYSDWPRYRMIWKLGLPIAVTMGLEGSVFGIAALLMGLINAESVAAHAIALQLASLTFMVPMGIAQAATVRVGIQYGRRDHAGIKRAGWVSFILGTSFMAAMAVVLVLAPEVLISIFIDAEAPGSEKVAALAVSFLAIAAIFQIADGAQVVAAGMLRGLHDTTVPMVFALMGYWFIGIGVGAGLAFWRGWEGIGVWTGLATGLAIVALLMLSRWMMREKLGLLPQTR